MHVLSCFVVQYEGQCGHIVCLWLCADHLGHLTVLVHQYKGHIGHTLRVLQHEVILLHAVCLVHEVIFLHAMCLVHEVIFLHAVCVQHEVIFLHAVCGVIVHVMCVHESVCCCGLAVFLADENQRYHA